MFLAVENCFTINLGVLSSVLYGWRSLEATVRERLKARGRRLKSKYCGLQSMRLQRVRNDWATKQQVAIKMKVKGVIKN